MKKRLRHLPLSLLASAVLLVVTVAVGWLLDGAAAALGAALGVALVVVSYLISNLVVAWVDMVYREALLTVVLLTYALKFAIFGVVLFRANTEQWAGLFALGATVIVATLVWTGSQLWWILHAKIPYVEIE